MFMYRSEEIDGYWYKDVDVLKRKIDRCIGKKQWNMLLI